ncbi:serine protease inhibitor 1-like [Lycium ferocissimum]|uniref:serine protease inhibitor 1-like n=1 Tax=Lycium ferocissimum TaxID=112874 RepID=UPI002815CD09|nr:serine protease inhibitor 1-like [Lycium ferocissimum]
MRKCLFLLSLCLLPFVAFSSTFTSENPIKLPTTTTTTSSANNNLVRVEDWHGATLDIHGSYRIVSDEWGALGGDVYLGPLPNSAAPCPDGVLKYNFSGQARGTPVRFIKTDNNRPIFIFENQDVNIQFVTRTCVNYTVWKVGHNDASLGVRFLETGGTIGQEDSSWFRIFRPPQGPRRRYFLMHCPGPFACPSCPIDRCRAVWVVLQNGRRRLALVNDPSAPSQQLRFRLRVYFNSR